TTYIGFILLTGLASDRFGRKRMLTIASISFFVLTVPAFMLLDAGSFTIVVLVQIGLGAMLTLNAGTLPSFLAEMLPTRIRSTLLIVLTNSTVAPGWYLMAAAAVCLGAVICAKETFHKPLREV